MTTGAVRLEQVTKRYGALAAVNSVDLEIEAGALLLMAGANGAGKSTLLRILAGLIRPTQGRVLVNGQPPHSSLESRAEIGLLSHKTLLYDTLTARENLLFYGRLYGLENRRETAEAALANVGMSARADTPVGTLSRGMKQRLALARATLHRPGLLLLDEPFEGLDRRASQALSQRLTDLRARGETTVVVVTHRVDEVVDLVDRVAVLERGRLCCDSAWRGGSLEELQALCDSHQEGA